MYLFKFLKIIVMFKKSFIFYLTSLVIFSNFIYGKDCTPKIGNFFLTRYTFLFFLNDILEYLFIEFN